uniref:CHK kinase-like domain-containing protein n=1 Tax=Panagrolaimus sp. PS1159 TaxID=55785 RepID=A0AC35FBQ1_9BILA
MDLFPEGDNEKLKLSFIDCHHSECDFYNKLAPILDIPVPTAHKTVEWILNKQEGCVHMEDLTLRGKCLLFYENINLTQVKCMIQYLAHMHKNVLCADPKTWKGEYLKRSKGLFDALDMFNASVDGFLDKCKHKVLCCDGVVRRQAEAFAVEFYYECLVKEFNGDVSLVPYTVEQLKKAYKYAYLTRALYIIGVMEYFVPGIETHISDEKIKAAFYESGALRSFHALQDADNLLQGELNDLFIKFGL